MYKIIISAYNEEDVIYKTLKSNIKHSSDIIVIDDGSIDNTWDEINKFSLKFPNAKIKKIRMKKNGKKVLSVRAILKDLSQKIKYIILLDADSTLLASKKDLIKSCKKLEANKVAAVSLKMIVKNKKSILGKILDIEYNLMDFLDSFVSKCHKLRCIHGGGSIFKRDILENALTIHSGEYYGEDLETTATIMENKHKIGYFPEIAVRTIVPSNPIHILKQRVRWEAGSIRSYIKKRNFYLNNFFNLDRHSLLWTLEILSWILFPLFLYGLFTHPNILPFSYLGSLGYVSTLSIGIKNSKFLSPLILIYPIFYAILVPVARIIALNWLIKYYFKK